MKGLMEEGNTDSMLDEGHDTFLMMQGKQSLGGEDEPHCCWCWTVPFRGQTYKFLTYNWCVNFPLSTIGFAIFTALFCLSMSLIPFCLGILLLCVTLVAARNFGDFDLDITRTFSNSRYLEKRPKPDEPDEDGIKAWAWTTLGCTQSWKDLFYLWLLKWPFSLFTTVFTFLLLVLSLACLGSLIIFFACPTCIKDGNLCVGEQSFPSHTGNMTWTDVWKEGTCSGWHIHRVEDCVALTFIGIPLLVISFHISNGLARANLAMSRFFLSDPEGAPTDSLLGYDLRAGTGVKSGRAYSPAGESKTAAIKKKYGASSRSKPSGYLDDYE